MTGLDKMINQILDEANSSAEKILEDARTSAEKIMDEAREEVKNMQKDSEKKTEAEIRNYKDRVISSSDLRRRTSLLEAKQELITAVVDRAYAVFVQKSGDEYFQIIREMLKKYALPQSGEIFFSQSDLEQMPAGFEQEIQEIAASVGGMLSLSKEAKNLDGGFILAYGGIEENCSFKAMFASRKDELQDQVQRVLFS